MGDSDGPDHVAGDGATIVLADEEAKSVFRLDFALSRVTLLQLATCAATAVAEPLLGTIDAYWVATLGTTALASLGPNTAVYSSVIAVVAAHGFGTAATRVMAVALEKDERARRDGSLARGEKPAPAQHRRRHANRGGVRGGVRVVYHRISHVRGELRGRGAGGGGARLGYMRARLGVPRCASSPPSAAAGAARDARTPLMAVMLAGSTNLILDPSFIFLFKMGFQGAAYATVVAQYAEAALMWWFAFRGPRRVNFFGAADADATETASASEPGQNSVASEAPEPSSYAFDRKLAWTFFREATSMLGRVANVVAVWAGTSALARIGVYSGAAHVLLFRSSASSTSPRAH